jgi:hypothetical protein
VIQEITAIDTINQIQLSQRKRQLLNGASKLFSNYKKTNDESFPTNLSRFRRPASSQPAAPSGIPNDPG